jgi:hypothetical protein
VICQKVANLFFFAIVVELAKAVIAKEKWIFGYLNNDKRKK